MQGQLDLIHLRERAEALQNLLEHLVHIGLLPVQHRARAVHANQTQKIVNDLCLAVNLLRNIGHELLVEFQRRIARRNQRVREHAHGGNRRL